MTFILQLIIFLLIVFIYLHIRFQLKINNNLEVYEIDYDTNENLQKVCDIRVPVLFDAPKSFVELPEFTKEQNSSEINIKDVNDTTPIKLSFSAASNLIREDKTSRYYSENNSNFIEENVGELRREFQKNDSLFAPQMTALTEYDIILGSRNTYTPFRYHVNYRRFLYVCRGQATIKLSSWKNEKNTDTIYNWKDFDFYSEKKVWSEIEDEKIKIIVPAGKVIFIPAYCWYSIKMTHTEDESETIVYSYSYKTYMNIVSILPKLIKSIIYKHYV